MVDDDPLWYKDAIIYEVHVRAFHDTDGDGMGDFRGLTHKLDYLQDLGVTAVWLLPFYPSPLKDDGYDIADYTDIHPHYGNLRDFQEFLEAAHQHGLRVITELVINHTSDQHPWFQRARRLPPGSPERDLYVWSDTPEKYTEARIIFKDFEHSNWSWDHTAKAYYWHRFYGHQPDLNYDNPAVWNAIFPVLDFWMGMGVDGMRLDAIPYLYEREGTNCENLPETHQFFKALRRHADETFHGRMFLAEANQWPEDAVAYFGNGDEGHMCFHFPLMPRMFMAIHMEDRFPIIDIMAQTPAIPDNCQWGLFLRNHDELTLEMVTDEERDYMYRAYADDPRARINFGIRRRLAPLLGNNRRRIELMKGLLFSLPGTPVLYYGDEIGMGDNIYLGDRNGVRTPMQWSADRNAGFSRANPQRLYLPVIIDPEYHYEALNVEAQQNNPNSLLWWTKRLIALRKRYKAFGRGSLEFLHPHNRKILAFLRRYHEEYILVVANLSRFVEFVELDLSAFQGLVPMELFGHNPFPVIGKQPYLLTVGPHAFYWFKLEPSPSALRAALGDPQAQLPVLTVRENWESLFRNQGRGRLEELLPAYLQQQPWLIGNGRTVKAATVRESFRLRYGETLAFITLVGVEYSDGEPQTYLLPLTLLTGETVERARQDAPTLALARIQGGPKGGEPGGTPLGERPATSRDGLLCDALADPAFCTSLLEAMATGRHYRVGNGELIATASPQLAEVRARGDGVPPPTLSKAPQTNTSVLFGNELILKVFRRAEEGLNPDLEIGRFFNTRRSFPHVPTLLGSIEYRSRRGEPITLALLQGYVHNEGHAWQFTLDELSRFFERVLALPAPQQIPAVVGSGLELAAREAPPQARELIDNYLGSAQLLGQRTAEMHLALAAETEQPDFAPEPFSTLYQRGVYQSLRNLKRRALERLAEQVEGMPEPMRTEGQRLLATEDALHQRLRGVLSRRFHAQRTRYHGDYHLGHVLYTGKDFVIIDFEGEADRSLTERRLKRSPLRDVVSMVRSFHYAAYSSLLGHAGRGRAPGLIRPEDVQVLEPWARFWYDWVSAAFLRAYLQGAGKAGFLPTDASELRVLFDVLLFEKVIHELLNELTHRPEMARIPLLGILQALESGT
ncbi:MAG TPA: maltose alpha-D-glucosyltransferase [Gemmataceae bacterium]|nr:maltose alpha-D-glucosyltransferase [Gemmataceae bacterium]